MGVEFSQATPVKKVRKARRCDWCPDRIVIGMPAVKIAYKYDGDFNAVYVHPECNDAWLRDPCNDEDEGCPYPHVRGMTCTETERIHEKDDSDKESSL